MSKPRGNKTSRAHRAARQQREVELLRDNPSLAELVVALRTSRTTLWRDLKQITQTVAAETREEARERRRQMVAEIDALKRIVMDSRTSDSRKVQLFLQLQVRLSKLLGLDAPSRSLVATFDLNKAVELMTDEEIVFHLCPRLTGDEWKRAREFMESLIAERGQNLLTDGGTEDGTQVPTERCGS